MMTRIVATAVMVLIAAVVHVAAAPGEAHARCDGYNEVKSQIINSTGAVLAEEWPKAGACNGNNTYVGYFRSEAAGWQASVWIQSELGLLTSLEATRMRKTVRRTLARIVATAVLVLAAGAIHAAAAPGQAQARCDGHTEVRSRILGSAGRVLAEEWPKAGSCNSNNTYSGYFISRWSGLAVYLWIQNNGVWRGWSCDWQIACEYAYPDDNYHSYIHLCVSRDAEWYCGWGEEVYHRLTHEAYGVNWGY